MEKSIFILRGLPGAGKSALAQALNIKAVCCADDYFVHNGNYVWNKINIEDAHNWCQRKCRRFMEKQVNKIIIANTCISEWELFPYQQLAKQFEYKCFVLIVENRHNGINVHNCPETVIEKMKKRFEIKL